MVINEFSRSECFLWNLDLDRVEVCKGSHEHKSLSSQEELSANQKIMSNLSLKMGPTGKTEKTGNEDLAKICGSCTDSQDNCISET